MESYLKCPVTALKLVDDNILLTGQGSKVIVYQLGENSVLVSHKIFKSSKIHAFIECEHSSGTWLVLGGKSVRCIHLNSEKKGCSVSFLCDEKVFKAWMWDAHWINEDSLLFISAHNTVVYWKYSTMTTSIVSSCVQQCILYSATFDLHDNQLVVAAGTVFNKVLLWKPEYCGTNGHHYKEIHKAFVGHEGVIFRVRFHPCESQLLSVSDDRSIRLWSITDESCLQVLYGHTARVWDAQYINNHIVSIGEDASCILWNEDGAIAKRFAGHKGKSIWSLEVSEEFIISGGGDGAIRMWEIKSDLLQIKGIPLELSIPEHKQILEGKECEDFPRTTKFITQDSLIVFTNNGALWRYDICKHSWTMLHEDQRFKSYCCLDINSNFIAMGNLTGLVKIISTDNPHQCYEEKLVSGKVFSLLWLPINSQRLLLICGPEGEMKVLALCNEGGEVSLDGRYLFTCPHSRQRWIAAAAVVEDDGVDTKKDFIFVCGDRRGSLHLYGAESKEPFQSILGVHGKTGVTDILSHDGYIYSTGRDGTFKKHKFDKAKKQLEIIDIQRACKGMEWIEGIWFHNSNVVVYGFYMQSHFAAWSCETNELLFKIKCGGGYRSWDVSFPDMTTGKTLGFTYMKGATVNLVNYNWRKTGHHRIIQESLHGREIVAVKVLGKRISNGGHQWLLVTCSEDTTINFYNYDNSNERLQCFHTAVGHIGGVKDIHFVPFSSNSDAFNGFFISCGSRTSLKIWKLKDNLFSIIRFSKDGVVGGINGTSKLSSHQFSCSLLTEIYTPETTSKKSKLKHHHLIDDMRYMACDTFLLSSMFPELIDDHKDVFCCVCACSDGFARIYVINNSRVELLASLDCDNHCALLVKTCSCYINGCQSNFVFTASTDGMLSIWNVSPVLEGYRDKLINNTNRNKFGGTNNDAVEDLFCDDDEFKDDFTEEKSTAYHINKDRYKFHDLCIPLFNSEENEIYAKLSLHQSGVNTFLVYQLINGFLVISGGDDGALCVATLCVSADDFQLVSKTITQGAHMSSVSAVKLVDESLVVSTSVDQRIRFWSLANSGHLALVHEILCDIADVSNMEVWISSGIVHVAVCGVGLELFSISLEDLKGFADSNRDLTQTRSNDDK